VNGRTDNAPAHPREDVQARVAAIVNTHGPALLRLAQRVSLCSDDAQDAVQRGLEIYWRRVETLDPTTEAAWLRVVVRNEAIAIRKARKEQVADQHVDLDEQIGDHRDLEERAVSSERVERSAEALSHLKRDEARALLMKAEGLSYDDISRTLSWSKTKVNRTLTDRAGLSSPYITFTTVVRFDIQGPGADGGSGQDPRLAIKSARRRGRYLIVSGTTAPEVVARVTVRVKIPKRKRAVVRRVSPRGGQWRLRIRLPRTPAKRAAVRASVPAAGAFKAGAAGRVAKLRRTAR
jgi:RNA polymerase sigma factor (sigma-70 family)